MSTDPEAGSLQGSGDPSEEVVKVKLLDEQLSLSIDEGKETTIYLVNGIRLSGVPVDFDSEVILFSKDTSSKPMVVLRSAIATFVPFGVQQARTDSKPRPPR